jgi:hypothetical protein
MAPPVSDVTAAQAMRQLAEHGEGYELQYEPRLAKAGKHHGFEPAALYQAAGVTFEDDLSV